MNGAPRDRDLLKTLGSSDECPDLTRRIMGRLGYMQAAEVVVQRRRRQRWFARAGIVLAGCLALAVGWQVHQQSDVVRQPAELTLPAALQQDMEERGKQFHRTLESLRDFHDRGRCAPTPTESERHRGTYSVAMGPMRWL